MCTAFKISLRKPYSLSLPTRFKLGISLNDEQVNALHEGWHAFLHDKLKNFLESPATKLENLFAARKITLEAHQIDEINEYIEQVKKEMIVDLNSHFAWYYSHVPTWGASDSIEDNIFDYCCETMQDKIKLAVIGWQKIKHVIGCKELSVCISNYEYFRLFGGSDTEALTHQKIVGRMLGAIQWVRKQCESAIRSIEKRLPTQFDGIVLEVEHKLELVLAIISAKIRELTALVPKQGERMTMEEMESTYAKFVTKVNAEGSNMIHIFKEFLYDNEKTAPKN